MALEDLLLRMQEENRKRQEEFARKEQQRQRMLPATSINELFPPPSKPTSTTKKQNTFLEDFTTPLKNFGNFAKEALNPFDGISPYEAFQQNMNKNVMDANTTERSPVVSEIGRGTSRVANTATFGLLEQLDKLNGNPSEVFQKRQGGANVADFGYDALGYLIPGVGTAKGLRALGLGAKSNKIGQLAKEGALTGLGMGAAEVGIREALNPDDYNWKQNLGQVALETAGGAVLDPAVHVAGKAVGKGVQNLLSKYAKGDVPAYSGKPSDTVFSELTPTLNQSDDLLSQLAPGPKPSNALYDQLLDVNQPFNVKMPNRPLQPEVQSIEPTLPKRNVPIAETIPSNQPNLRELTELLRPKKPELPQVDMTTPEPPKTTVDPAFQQAVDEQFQYLKDSMNNRKGVQQGGIVRDELGEVVDRYGRISENPGWYQEFYRVNKRKPTNKDLRELAEKHVLEGFEDEVGRIPSWEEQQKLSVENQVTPPQEQAATLENTQPTKDLKSDLAQFGIKEITPESIATGYNQKTWYHGTGTKGLTNKMLDDATTNHEGLFGQGVYLTDSPTIAKGYAKARGKKTGNEVIYETAVDVDKVLDLESPMTPDVYRALLETTNELDEFYYMETGKSGDFTRLLSELADSGGTTEEAITMIRREVADFSMDLEIPSSEFVEYFNGLSINLKAAGFDGITHTGGGRVGKERHRVLILLDPNNVNSGAKPGRSHVKSMAEKMDKIDEASQPISRAEKLREKANKLEEEATQLREQNVAETSNIVPGQPIQKGKDYSEALRSREGKRQETLKLVEDLRKQADASEKHSAKMEKRAGMSETEKKIEKTQKDLQKAKQQLAKAEGGNNPALAPFLEKLRKDVPKLEKRLERLRKEEAILPMRTRPDGVKAMKQESIPLPNRGTQNEKTITRQQLLTNMKKNLGVVIRTGKMGPVDQDVQGYFKVQPEVIRSKRHGDIQVISHEIGHHLDKQHNLTTSQFDNELLKLGQVTSGSNYTTDEIREEGLAEFIRLYLTDPQTAQKDAPRFFSHFEKTLPTKVMKGLKKTQNDVDVWITQGDEKRFEGKIDFSGKEKVNITEKVDKVYSQFVDKFDTLRKVEKEITGKISDASNSLYKKARLSVGAPKKGELILRDLKDILKPIDKYGYNMKDVSKYAAARHAFELEKMGERVLNEAFQDSLKVTSKTVGDFEKKYGIEIGKRQLETLKKGGKLVLTDAQKAKIERDNRIESGFTLNEIQSILTKFKGSPMEAVQQQLVGYNNKLVDMLNEVGILSDEAVTSMRKKYPDYVPFYRFFEDDMTAGWGNKGFTNLTNPVKRMKGSTRDIINPLESMIKNTFAVVNAVEKNKVGLELSRLADIEGAGHFVERLDGKAQDHKDSIVTVFEDGEKVQYKLEPELYRSMQLLDEEATNILVKILSAPTNVLRAGATLTPEFMLRNPIRDQFQAFVVSEYGYNPIIDLPRGLWHVIRGKSGKSDIYKQWVENGGGYGNYLSQDRNYLKEQLSQLKKEGHPLNKGVRYVVNPKEWLRLLQSLSELSEEATKVGEFRKAVKQKGATPQEAAFQSRDLMDFGRSGSITKVANRAVAFLNANVQGKDKLIRTFKQHPVRSTVRSLVGVTLPTIGAYLAMEHMGNNTQKEAWRNTPKWVKDSYFILPIPGTDELARIPKPFDLAPVFSNLAERMMDDYYDNDPEGWNEFIKSTGSNLAKIPLMLTALTPIIENITNYSFFTGGPIVPQRDQGLMKQDQYGVNTSLLARTIGEQTAEGGVLSFLPDQSPYKVDNFIRGYGAGLGQYATSGIDTVLKQLRNEKQPTPEAKKWSELPVINAFTVDTTGGGKVMNDFYDLLNKLQQQNNSANRNKTAFKDKKIYSMMNEISRDISDIRKEYREVQASTDMTPKNKRARLDKLDKLMNELAKKAVERAEGKEG